MGIPQPWSFSKLKAFVTCPARFNAEYVTKSVKTKQGQQQLYGTRVHKDFEDFQRSGTPLPLDLSAHQDYMDELKAIPGAATLERKVGLNTRMEPCDYWDKDIWWRGVIDFQKPVSNARVKVVDYKTGKLKVDMQQLHLFAFYLFCEGWQEVEVSFYWTQLMKVVPNPIVMPCSQKLGILRSFMPDLQQYVEAFRTDVWQPRPSGLCREWCPCLGCEHNGGGAKVI